MKRLLAVFTVIMLSVGWVFTASLTLAQVPTAPPPNSVQGLEVTLAVTATSGRAQLPSSIATFPVVLVVNTGAKDAFVRFGTVTSVAVVTDLPIRAGHALALYTSGTGTYLAAICGGADSTSLDLYQFNGPPVYK